VLAEGCWHFVAATFDVATQEVKIYVNGVEVSSSPNNTGVVSSIADTDIPVQVGAFTPASGIPENFWHGFIDELEIYDRALSSSEIEGIYSAGVAGKCKVDQAATCNTPACNNRPDRFGGLVFDGQDWEGAVTFTFDDVAAACASDLVAQGCTGSEAFLFSKCRSEIATDGRCVNCVRGFSCSDCRSCRDGLRFGFFGECGGEFVIDTCVEP
jgi:hypothetical protein